MNINESTVTKNNECRYCGKICAGAFERVAHERIHTGEKPFECNLCDYRCTTKTSLTLHMLVHTGEKPHKCTICGTCFRQKSALKTHMIVHSDERPFACEFCKFRARHQGNLNVHMKTHKEQEDTTKIYKCKDCDEEFEAVNLYTNHRRRHSKFLKKVCEDCEITFTDSKEYREHLEKHRLQPESFFLSCDQCPLKFKNAKLLEKHVLVHSEIGSLKCDLCSDLKFASKKAFILHSETHKDDLKKNALEDFTCVLCDTLFEDASSLSDHLSHQHDSLVVYINNHRTYKCPICNQCVKNGWPHFQGHYRAHKGELPFVCTQCPKKFASKEYLAKHMKTHNGFCCKYCRVNIVHKEALIIHEKQHLDASGNVQFKCEQCEQEFENGPDYAAHYKDHYNQLPYGCNLCERRFQLNSGLLCHVREIHNGEGLELLKNNICNFCGIECENNSKRIIHERQHTGERPFVCNICNYRGVTKHQLKSHNLSSHTEEKKYKCETCNKFSTNDKYLFKIHMKSHQGEFGCTVCGRQMANQMNLRAHMKRHQTEPDQDELILKEHKKTHRVLDDNECELCGKRFTIRSTFHNHKTMHKQNPGELTFSCNQCPKKFENEEMLQKHNKIHLGVLPFQCKECPNTFETKKQLGLHQRKHSNAEAKKAEVESSTESRKRKLPPYPSNSNGQKAKVARSDELTEENSDSEYSEEVTTSDSSQSSEEETPRPSTSFSFQLPRLNDDSNVSCKTEPSPVIYSELPVAAFLFRRITSKDNGLMLIWLKKAESDIFAILGSNCENCLVFCQEEVSSDKCTLYGLKKATFTIDLVTTDEIVQWHLYSSKTEYINNVHNQQFESYHQVESIMGISNELINIIRYTENDWLQPLTNQLLGQVFLCNHNPVNNKVIK